MNKVILIGRLSKDVECRYTSEGKAIANISIAVDRKFKRDGQPEADFFSCTAFGKTAETFEKCSIAKGTKLLIEGEIQNDNYEKDGVKHYGTKVIVNSFEFCESKNSAAAPTQAPAQTDSDGFMNIPDGSIDDLPFM